MTILGKNYKTIKRDYDAENKSVNIQAKLQYGSSTHVLRRIQKEKKNKKITTSQSSTPSAFTFNQFVRKRHNNNNNSVNSSTTNDNDHTISSVTAYTQYYYFKKKKKNYVFIWCHGRSWYIITRKPILQQAYLFDLLFWLLLYMRWNLRFLLLPPSSHICFGSDQNANWKD